MSDVDVQSVATKAMQDLRYDSIKSEQLEIVTSALRGRDVFGVLPTGFGKSLCFACLPFAYYKLYPAKEASIVLVVSPLTVIMKDQASIIKVCPIYNVFRLSNSASWALS